MFKDTAEARSSSSLNTIYFESDSYELKNEDLERIDDFVNYVNTLDYDYYLRVLGCADPGGESHDNLTLTKLRAENVKKQLIERDINEDDISCFYFGEFDHYGEKARKVTVQIICED